MEGGEEQTGFGDAQRPREILGWGAL